MTTQVFKSAIAVTVILSSMSAAASITPAEVRRADLATQAQVEGAIATRKQKLISLVDEIAELEKQVGAAESTVQGDQDRRTVYFIVSAGFAVATAASVYGLSRTHSYGYAGPWILAITGTGAATLTTAVLGGRNQYMISVDSKKLPDLRQRLSDARTALQREIANLN